jgi:hypothetical protein
MHPQGIPRPDELNGRAEQDLALVRHPGVDRIDQHGDLGSAERLGTGTRKCAGIRTIVAKQCFVVVSVWCSKWQTRFGAFDASGYSGPEGSLPVSAQEDKPDHRWEISQAESARKWRIDVLTVIGIRRTVKDAAQRRWRASRFVLTRNGIGSSRAPGLRLRS